MYEMFSLGLGGLGGVRLLNAGFCIWLDLGGLLV